MDKLIKFKTFAEKSLIRVEEDFSSWQKRNIITNIQNIEIITGREDYMMVVQYKV